METFISSWVVIALTVLIVKVLYNPLTSGHPVEVTYAEFESLGTSCYPSDSCQINETGFGLNLRSCDCDSSCSMYGTCCVDSEFRIHKNSHKHKSNLKCLSLYNSPGFDIFMVDSCKNDETFDNLCLSNPEESNDPFLIIPVTSNVTGFTYKNYFCAVCNEEVDSEQLEFWDMQIWVNGTLFKNLSEPQFKFNKMMGLWTVNDGKHNETSTVVPVTLKIQQNLQATVKYCLSDLIENCSSNWTDEAVTLKCRDYMAIVIDFQNVRYKNPHCALCNFENLSNLQCNKFSVITDPTSANDRIPTRSRDPEDRVPTKSRHPEGRVPTFDPNREGPGANRRRQYDDPEDGIRDGPRYYEDPEDGIRERPRYYEDSGEYRRRHHEDPRDRVPNRPRYYEDSDEFRPRHRDYPEDRTRYENPEEYRHRIRGYSVVNRDSYDRDDSDDRYRSRDEFLNRPGIYRDIPLIKLFVLEDRHKRCGKNMVYDKFAKKCRCNSRIYAKDNGKCVHKI